MNTPTVARSSRALPKALAGCLALGAVMMTSCQSPPVWRSASLSPQSKMPTLVAASAYDFQTISRSVDLTGVDLKAAGRAVNKWAKENPDQVLEGIFSMKDSFDAANAAAKIVKDSGPSMHDKAMAFLRSQGFELEFDEERATKLIGGGTIAGKFSYVAPDTAPRPFGSTGEQSMGGRSNGIKLGQMPIWGPGSDGSIAERLATGRPSEAYASVHARFVGKGNRPEQGTRCDLTIQVISQAGELIFEGRTVGTAPAGDANAAIQTSFDEALAQMQQPIVLE